MGALVFPITLENLGRIHPTARQAVFWELSAPAATEVETNGDPALEKEAWLMTTLFEHGCCGYNIGYASDEFIPALATILFCPPHRAPGAKRLPTAPVSADATLITSLFLDNDARDKGMETVLIDTILAALSSRNIPAVEAFGSREIIYEKDSEVANIIQRADEIGLIPLNTLIKSGFEIIRDHPAIPRLRLELPPAQGLLTAAEAELLLATVSST